MKRIARALRRDPWGLLALGVIALYLVVGLAVGGGLISRTEAFARVGPGHQGGLGSRPSVEERLDALEFQLGTLGAGSGAREPSREHEERRAAASSGFDELLRRFEQGTLDSPVELEPLEAEVRALLAQPEGWDGLRRRAALCLGTDQQGRSILFRALYSVKVALQVGVVAALISVALGTLLGGLAGFLGGWPDRLVVWLFSTFSSIPWIVLLLVLASLFLGTRAEGTLVPVYVAFCLTFWIAPCRVTRAEVLKLRELDYVQAARSAGFGRLHILLRHVLPNTLHLVTVNFSLLFVAAIKAEVILSFLGLGVRDEPSWGVMIHQAVGEVVQGFYWQIGAATGFMFFLVLAFNVFADALQDALGPREQP